MLVFVGFLGTLAGICTTAAFLPQVLKILKTRSVADISIVMYVIFCLGLILWISYGFLLGSIPLIAANMVTLVLALTILWLKIVWNKRVSKPMV